MKTRGFHSILRLFILPILAGICLLFFSQPVQAQFYNGSQMDFGKNRVQYRKNVFWSFYRFQKYDIYFYLGGKELSHYTARYADKEIKKLEKLFDYNLEDRVQFIVFNKLSDLKESNIGLKTEQQYNIGGVTHIVGSKVILYFDGDHRSFEEQIKAGITQVMVNQMMYGGSVKDVVRNSTLLTLPEWYTQGLISYISRDWDAEVENRVKDGILSRDYEKFNRLTGEEARYAGHSIWKYIAETYGESVISNILYMTKISRNIDSGFLFVLGISLKNLSYEWLAYYDKMFYNRNKKRNLPEGEPLVEKPKENCKFTKIELSRNGKYAAYSTNEMGQWRVYVHDYQTGKTKRIIKVGHRLEQKMDESFPLLDWHPNSKLLAMISERKGKIWLTLYNMESKEKIRRPLFNFEKILDFSYSDDGKEFAFSAVQRGETDIFVYNITSNTYYQVTDDIYGDFNPQFINNSKEIVFASNRNNDTIKEVTDVNQLPHDASTDLYIFNYRTREKILKRITQTPFVNETQPVQYDSAHIAYLSDANGVVNRYMAELDSVIAYVDTVAHYSYISKSYPVTNYKRNIEYHDVVPQAGKMAEIIYRDNRYWTYVRPTTSPTASAVEGLKDSPLRAKLEKEKKSREKREMSEEAEVNIPRTPNKIIEIPDQETEQPETEDFIDIDHYVFEGEKKEREKQKDEKPQTLLETEPEQENGQVKPRQDQARALQLQQAQGEEEGDSLVFPKLRNYDVSFKTEYVVSQLNNNFINSSYQKFTGGGAVFFNPGLNGLFKLAVSDVMEDYRIIGGFRLAGNLNSNEFFLNYQDFKKRLDREIFFHRQSFQNVSDFSIVKVHTHNLFYSVKWPFSQVSAVKGTAIGRNDREVYQSTDLNNLQRPNVYTWTAGLKGEYIFDNTIGLGLNLYRGWRFKIWGEIYKEVTEKEKYFTVFGADFRHYLKIHRELIWANRFAISTSQGPQKLIYYLGGVDNWFVPKFDNSIPIDYDQNYAYQTVATNMRGFYQNIRNGNSMALFNSEVRWPVFKYLLNRPIKSDFLNNFQLVTFGDIGTAWTGPSPYSEENSLNTQVIENGPLTIRIKNQKEPIVGGYGLGVRSRLLGYFIRVDYAWGVENGQVLDPLWYVSLSLDF